MRVGFLFNHYAPHQVPHAAPYAFELSRLRPDWEIVLACSTPAEERLARKIAALYPGERTRSERLRPSLMTRLKDLRFGRRRFVRKKGILADNLAFFRSLDALVAPERHCLMLRRQLGVDRLHLIHTRHGAGDRASGFDERAGAFDLTLLAGRKLLNRFEASGRATTTRSAVVGYPKFEVVRRLHPTRPRLFADGNPVILYNPHFDQELGSWARMGRAVLDFFFANPSWNLIFAPHVVLFRRRERHQGYLPWRYRFARNILVDTGSERSTDMTYALAADIYLGDVSSQVYEFLLEPRPCLFLDAHGVTGWRQEPSYAHWRLGEVIGDTGRLGAALARARAAHARCYLPRQRAAFACTFHEEPGSTAARRGAEAIACYLRSVSA
jgi:hypothetical protein